MADDGLEIVVEQPLLEECAIGEGRQIFSGG